MGATIGKICKRETAGQTRFIIKKGGGKWGEKKETDLWGTNPVKKITIGG